MHPRDIEWHMERGADLLGDLSSRYLSGFTASRNFDRQNNLFPCALDDLGLFALGLDHVVTARGLPQLALLRLTLSSPLQGCGGYSRNSSCARGE